MTTQSHKNILLVDDDPHIATLFSAVLDHDGFSTLTAEDGAQALALLETHDFDLVITDLTMPRVDGFTLIEALRENERDLPIIVVTGESSETSIQRALDLDALTFLTKPISTDELRFAVKQALREAPARMDTPHETPPQPHGEIGEAATDYLERNPNVIPEFPEFIGKGPVIIRIKKMIAHVADKNSNVLILGESGTGKEVVARSLHYNSGRRSHLFVPVNCGAIPEELLESELFGHEKGAFTGAINSRKGRFELAEGGSLFLDEIGEMSLNMQVKLLRVLQEKTFERVGGNKTMHADVRIIAATHRNLEEAIEQGRFREDLYYRLNVFPIEIPPLRERVEDIPLLIQRWMSKHKRTGRDVVEFTESAMEVLMSHVWKGNVRELENLLQRMIILYPNSTVDAQDLPAKYQPEGMVRKQPIANQLTQLPEQGMDLKNHLHHIEYSLIEQALERSGYVVAHAAEQLGMRRTTLVEKLRKYGFDKKTALRN